MSKNTTILFLFMSLVSLSGLASPVDSLSRSIEDSTLTIALPPLDSLFKWAEKNSPLIHEQMALIEKTDEDTRRIQKIWMDAIKFSANAQDGNFGDPVANKLTLGYSSGMSISFSLYQLASYRNLVKVYKSEEKVARYKRDQTEFDTRKMVIILYNNIIGQRNILKIRSDGAQASYTHMKMAEREFREGTVAVGELSRVTEIYTKAQVDYEVGLNDLRNYYMELEQMIGRPLNK